MKYKLTILGAERNGHPVVYYSNSLNNITAPKFIRALQSDWPDKSILLIEAVEKEVAVWNPASSVEKSVSHDSVAVPNVLIDTTTSSGENVSGTLLPGKEESE